MSSGNESPPTEDRVDPSGLSTFLKYCSDDDQVIKGIFKDKKIRFTQPWALNDPLEFNPRIGFRNRKNYRLFRYDGVVFPSAELWVRLNLIERRINESGILSLTKVYDSFDMWSRYANGHKGFLLEFKSDFNEHPCMLSPTRKSYPVRKVDYVDEYAIDMEELVDQQGQLRHELAQEQLFFRKVSRWQSEQEYRMVRPFSDLPDYASLASKPHRDDRVHLFDFSFDCIEAVMFGARMSIDNKKRIMRACEGLQIHFVQAIIIRDERDASGVMGKVKMVPAHLSPKVVDVLPFNLIGDLSHVKDQQDTLEVTSLSELPYWEDAQAWVQWYYEEKKRSSDKS